MVDYDGRFVWYELMTTDMGVARAFYAKVMGWGAQDLSVPGLPYTLFTTGGASAAGLMSLSEEAKQTGANPMWIGYVGVNDVDATADRILRLGGSVPFPPTDILDYSRFAVVTDAQLATLALIKWLTPARHHPAKPGQLGRVGWHELLAADVETAFAFYHDVFDWQKVDADIGPGNAYQLFSAGAQPIGGMFTKPISVPAPFWLYYFNTGDIDAAAERVKAGGGRIVEGPLELPGGSWMVRCADPQGAVFGLEGKRTKRAVGYFERAPSPTRRPT